MPETVYYRLDDGGAVVRELDGWRPQVWRPSLSEWVDLEVNLATDGRVISMNEALAETGTTDEVFGEFAPTEGENGAE